MDNSVKNYHERKELYLSRIAEQTHTINLISNLRLMVFAAGAGLGIYLIVKKNFGLLLIDLLVFPALFVALVIVHERYFRRKTSAATLLKINEDSLKRIAGEWHAFPDSGEEFCDDSHPYAQDLDIFGQGSLFQYINTAGTFLGRLKLRDYLSSPPETIEEIASRQEAVRELASRLDWRQRFQAEGVIASKMHHPEALLAWAGSVDGLYLKPPVKLAFRFIPFLTAVIGLVTVLQTEPNYYPFIAALLIQFLLLKINGKKRVQSLGVAFRYAENIAAYSRMLQLFETEDFHCPALQEFQKRLKDRQGHPAYSQIGKLVQIVEAISNRHNAFYFIFNILFLLDYQWMFALEKWKEKSGRHLEAWLNVLGESEALSSLAVIQHDHPQWAAPELSCGKSPVKGMALNRTMPVFAAEKMGHPLLGNSCVPNDLVFKRPENILLVTGSNMSGKSTLLRTAGINLVLAFAGTTVCAEKFSCSLMDIHTCMRVSDDLEKNISSFYAELLRIKMIVQAVEEERPVFFLLDEIFKGTNSVDRHAGAKALIKKFSQEKILGMISTHDLELGDLERESPKVKNYHFQEYYVNDRICFDYKLRPGVSKTRNAAFLIKMAGIEIEKD